MKPIYKLTKSQLLAENATLAAQVSCLLAEIDMLRRRRWWEFWR
jgi:hypothetical protein